MTENERIAVKEGAQGGLTEGQQAQMARNDKAIAAIRLQARLTSKDESVIPFVTVRFVPRITLYQTQCQDPREMKHMFV